MRRWWILALLAGCDDAAPGATPAVDASVRDMAVVPGSVCGNGFLEAAEACDDGNTDDGDGCSARCAREPRCGDGTLDAGEGCDDGNLINRDGCSDACVPEAGCGNGTLDDGEGCDDGNTADGDGCSATCSVESFCGDGVLDAGEACDDGNEAGGDGCSALCEVEPGCGDGVRDANEGCDDGNEVDGDGCSATCTVESACGNGEVDAGEACDDGNGVDGDGCSAACIVESFCGDGEVDAGEACDDGNGVDGDGCSAACFVESFCGDGVLDAGEACDDGNAVDGDGCSAACFVESFCGDGEVDAGEACDDGNNVDGDRCSAACLVEPFCGDGLLDAGEACDDGNAADGDGCSAACVVEPRCGDGALDAGEACDDGNTDPGDGCAADCSVEAPVCGNGRREAGEGCDDGNLDGGDGCGPTCRPEACGDGFLRAPEECDDGNVNAADGCDGLCLVEAVDITGGGRFLGGFQAGSFDRFTFTLAARSTVRLDTSDGAAGCPGDTEAVILDAQGAEITGDSGDGACASIRTELPAGRFTLVVRAAGGVGLNRYTLDAAFIAVPVQVCGDRVLGDAEECDDGNVNAGDGCDAACRVEPVDISAGGDFFGSFPARSLDRYVFRLAGPHQVDLSTGDGVGGCPGDTRMVLSAAGGGEQARAEDGAVGACAALSLRMDVGQYLLVVDNAARGAVGAYFLNARFRPIRDPGAACDPTQRLDLCADGSECRGNPAICRVGACGDGVVNPGEQCDDRNVVAGDGCDAACRTEACGNGRVDAGEQCDDGNVVPGDGCDAGCRDEAFCGDGAVDPGEACDDGNTRPGDGCDDTCQREPVCGDGMINVAGEQCDDGNTRPGDGCDEICRREPACGDGMINVAGEQCDDGNRNNGDGCDSQCRREPACGDGVVNQANEQCDDGNRNNGDGCSAQCQREAPPNLCGNNRLDAGEACDDGNLREGDGCDSLCSFELYTLIGARSTVQGRIPAGGRDILRFIVDDRSYIGALTTALGGVGCAGDTVLSLYRIQGNRQLVAQDDDTAGNGCSLLRFEPLAAGTYELEVTARAALLDYQVDVFHSVIVDRLGLFNGTFVAGGDDNFSFGLDGLGVIFLETLGCGGDTIMTLSLVDANGDLVELAFDDDGGVGVCSYIELILDAGDYQVDVRGYNGQAAGPYQLSVDLF